MKENGRKAHLKGKAGASYIPNGFSMIILSKNLHKINRLFFVFSIIL